MSRVSVLATCVALAGCSDAGTESRRRAAEGRLEAEVLDTRLLEARFAAAAEYELAPREFLEGSRAGARQRLEEELATLHLEIEVGLRERERQRLEEDVDVARARLEALREKAPERQRQVAGLRAARGETLRGIGGLEARFARLLEEVTAALRERAARRARVLSDASEHDPAELGRLRDDLDQLALRVREFTEGIEESQEPLVGTVRELADEVLATIDPGKDPPVLRREPGEVRAVARRVADEVGALEARLAVLPRLRVAARAAEAADLARTLAKSDPADPSALPGVTALRLDEAVRVLGSLLDSRNEIGLAGTCRSVVEELAAAGMSLRAAAETAATLLDGIRESLGKSPPVGPVKEGGR
ncbi:MAG: hypothetical protein L0216_07055 [Planctomycetales bacterium]|nr:hypothetical protein [Planctomycetales bacterium]